MKQETNGAGNESLKVMMPILVALGGSHLLNDIMQSIVSASYPLVKADLSISFTEVGIISLVYQIASSVFQPFVGFYFDKRPFPYVLPIATCSTLFGLILFSLSSSVWALCISVFFVGIGSAMLHPEASRVTSLASVGHRGLAQSLFQVGGNIGSSVGPLLVALFVAPFGRPHMAWFSLISITALLVSRPICRWYASFLANMKRVHSTMTPRRKRPLSCGRTTFALVIIVLLIFSKYIYMASMSNYYTFYVIEHFGVSISVSQILLFVFLAATAAGTLVGGPVGDRIGRKYVIWLSILGAAPFSLSMPYMGFWGTIIMSFGAGFMMSSAFPAILLYAQELLPNKLGLISGLFFGFAFGVAGIASAILGRFADLYNLDAVFRFCSFSPLAGIVAAALPNLHIIKRA